MAAAASGAGLGDARLVADDLYRGLFNETPEAICVTSRSGRIEEINQAGLDLFGYCREELLGRNFGRLYHTDQERLNFVQTIEAQGQVANWPVKLKRRDGESVDCLMTAVVRRGPSGEIQGYQGFIRDNTVARQAQKNLERERATFQLILHKAPYGVAVIEPDGTFSHLNPEFINITGYTLADVPDGRTWFEKAFPDPDLRARAKRLWREDQTKAKVNRVFPVACRDGQIKTLDLRCTILGDGRAVLTFIDMTEARRAEEDLKLQKAFLESLFHLAPEAIAVLDNEDQIIRINQEFSRLFGHQPEEAKGRKINSLIVDPNHKSEANGYSQTVLGGEKIAAESVRRRKDGSPVQVSITGAPVEVGGGRVGIYAIYRDITAQKEAEEALRDSERRHRVVLESAPDPIVVSDVEGRVTYLNPAFTRIFGWTIEEVRGRKVDFIPVESWPETAIMIQMIKRGETFSGIETRRLTKDGRIIDVSISGAVYVDSKGQGQGSVLTLQDITVRKLTEEQLRFIAYHDPLTGLPNRKSFYERLEELLNQSGRDAGHCFGLMFLDLDRFKYINDTLGHDVGDLLLKQVSYRLEDSLRKTDHVFRLGGDEFTVILANLSHDIDAAKVAEKVLEVIAQPYQIKGHLLYVSTSIGIAIYPADGRTVETLVRNADTAMYEAKKDENRYRFFTAEMNNKALLRLQMENLLRSALDKDQFRLHYQPLVDDGRGIVGVEALLRWSSPELGEVSPELFIPVAEETGLIVALGEWVLVQACRQVKAWQNAGRADFYVAVNLSPRQFRHKGLVQTIARILDETDLPPACLKLEVTESSVMENPEEAIAKMRHLHSLGLRFAIDDFGTGYSSLSYLKRFPVETLKIDRSFVQELAANSDDEEIVKTIIAMARNLNIETLAEGVETDEQRRFLLKQGCNKMQGYLFGRPLPPEDLERLLAMSRQA